MCALIFQESCHNFLNQKQKKMRKNVKTSLFIFAVQLQTACHVFLSELNFGWFLYKLYSLGAPISEIELK